MNDAIKHTAGTGISGMGFFASMSLTTINQWASLICAIIGIIAGLCTIHSWWKKRTRKK